MQEACVGLRYERNQVDKLSSYNKAYVAAISFSLCRFFVFFVFFVSYVNVYFCHILHAFFLLSSHLHFVPYIFVLVFHVHLVLVYRPFSRFPEPDFQHLVSRLLYRLFVFSF